MLGATKDQFSLTRAALSTCGFQKAISYQSCFGLRTLRVNYQQRGLGAALLVFVIRAARENGHASMTGTLVRNYLKQNPRLVNWYQSHGFRVEMNEGGSGNILLELSRA